MPINNALMERLALGHPIIQAPLAGGGDTPDLVAASGVAGAIGAIFGIGFLREYLENEAEKVRIIREFFKDETEPSLFDTARAEIEWRHEVLQRALKDLLPERDRIRYFELTKQAEAAVTNWQRKKLVRRSHLRTIVMAWLITVPATAAIAALLFLAVTAMVAPPGAG